MLLAALGCSAPAPHQAPTNHTTGTRHDETALLVEYRTWGLMPPPKCGGASYEIRIARDHAVTCGWHSECPPYSSLAPLRAKPAGRLRDDQTIHLAELANSEAFFALPPFSANIHIIDGGAEQIHVVVGARDKTVEMANTSAPAFTALRDALQTATGCSIATAGPEPR